MIPTWDSCELGAIRALAAGDTPSCALVCHTYILCPIIDTWYWSSLMAFIFWGMLFFLLCVSNAVVPTFNRNGPNVPNPIQEQHMIPEVHGVMLCS